MSEIASDISPVDLRPLTKQLGGRLDDGQPVRSTLLTRDPDRSNRRTCGKRCASAPPHTVPWSGCSGPACRARLSGPRHPSGYQRAQGQANTETAAHVCPHRQTQHYAATVTSLPRFASALPVWHTKTPGYAADPAHALALHATAHTRATSAAEAVRTAVPRPLQLRARAANDPGGNGSGPSVERCRAADEVAGSQGLAPPRAGGWTAPV